MNGVLDELKLKHELREQGITPGDLREHTFKKIIEAAASTAAQAGYKVAMNCQVQDDTLVLAIKLEGGPL